MSVEIKSLSNAAPTMDNSLPAPNDNFNIIPNANVVYDLYTAANDATTKKTAIVNTIRLVNISGSAVTVNLYFNRPNASGQYRRRQISPVDLTLQPGALYVDSDEITLEPGDRVQAKANTANAVQYLISGVERDVL